MIRILMFLVSLFSFAFSYESYTGTCPTVVSVNGKYYTASGTSPRRTNSCVYTSSHTLEDLPDKYSADNLYLSSDKIIGYPNKSDIYVFTYDDSSGYDARYCNVACIYYSISETTPPVTCTDRQKLDPDTNTCIDVCPPMMTRKTVEGVFFDTDSCFPDTNVSKEQCLQNSDYIWAELGEDLESQSSVLALTYGKGCYNKQYMQDKAYHENLSFLVGGLLPDLPTSYLARFGETIFSSGKSLFNYISDFFKSKPDDEIAGLITYEPEIIDVEIVNGFTQPVINYTPKPITFNGDTPVSNLPKPSPGVPPVDNLYLPDDMTTFESNSVISKSVLDDYFIPPKPNGAINSVVESTITVKSNLSGTQTVDVPLTSVKTNEINLADRVETEYRSVINTSDDSQVIISTKEQALTDGSKIYDVEITTPIKTTEGVKNYQKSYVVTKDPTGAVTNTTYKTNSSLTSTSSSGGTVTSTNTVTNPTPINESASAVDLSPVNSRLDELTNTLKDLKDYKPQNYTTAESKLSDFTLAITNYSNVLDNANNFLNGLQDNINTLINDFNDAKSIFENKPTMTVATGSCPFQAQWIQGQTISVNPCEFISPYKPILSLFFTLFFTIGVLGFALKYLFNVSLGGNK
ncbi:hypothetical protein ACKGJI_04590 [Sulfurospirillum sp. 1307]